MKKKDNFENTIRDFCRTQDTAARTTPQFDRRVLDDALPAQPQTQPKSPVLAGLRVRRIMMHGKMTGLTAVAIIVVAIVLGLSVFHSGATPAYAVTDTIKAMKEIETVYMKGEFYLQGQFECWMRFEGNPDRPTHVWLGRAGENLCKICSPAGVFGFNQRSNRVHFARRDERGKSWIPKFGSLFKDATRRAGRGNAVTIHDQLDEATGATLIAIDINSPKRQQRFLVDPETKLPVRFETLREEACLELTRQTCQAMVDLDRAKLESLALFFRLWPPQIWEQVEKMKAAGQWVQSYEITGEPYQEGDRRYVPTQVKGPGDNTEVQTVMIKFYDFDGATHAFSIGSKEKGVVD